MKHLSLFLLWVFSSPLSAQPGSLDPSFGSGGILKLANSFDFGDMLMQPDGKILVLGSFNYFLGSSELLRLLPNGDLDVSFSDDGIAETNGNPNSNDFQVMRGLALQSDGKIICCGRESSPTHQGALILVRFNANGTRDNSFGSGAEVFAEEPVTMEPFSVAVQSDGKIIAQAQYSGKTHLYRFLSNGNVDAAFGANGKLVLDFASHNSFKVLVQPDDKILLAGQRQYPPSNYDGFIARLMPNGAYDNTFGTNGIVEKDFEGGFDAFFDLAVQPDGKVLAAGKAKVGGNTLLSLLRYLPNGSPDLDFGLNGTSLIEAGTNCQAKAVALQPDGKILVTGTTSLPNYNYITARYQSDGSIDPSFSGDGVVFTDVGSPSLDFAEAIVVQPDGKILVGGGNGSQIALVRYLSGLSVGLVDLQSVIALPIVYPNPIKDQQILLEYELPVSSSVRIELLDLQGKTFANLLDAERASGKNKETLTLPGSLASGFYLLGIRTKTGNAVLKIEVLNN